MIRRPPRSTLDRSSAASDVYKRQAQGVVEDLLVGFRAGGLAEVVDLAIVAVEYHGDPVSYTHLRAHETVLDLVCRLLLEKKKTLTPRSQNHLLSRKNDYERPKEESSRHSMNW